MSFRGCIVPDCRLHFDRFKKTGDPLRATVLRGRNHGYFNTPTHRIWSAMKRRCFNKNAPNYKWYGARGITVCDRWLLFENFLEDMGERPGKLTLDRTYNDGNYEPGNCRWATMKEQSSNRRSASKWTDERRKRHTEAMYRAWETKRRRASIV
jgi:hypothetical protein